MSRVNEPEIGGLLLLERLKKLEEENRLLKERVSKLEKELKEHRGRPHPAF